MNWDVIEVVPEKHLVLNVRFKDGTQGRVLFKKEHLTGVFESLNSPQFFRKVYINHGAVSWPGELDLAPDAMHEAIKEKGEWVLE